MKDGKKLDEATLATTWEITNDCYERACGLMGYSMQSIREEFFDDIITEDEYVKKSEEFDEKYRWLLCELPTGVLTNVIIAWENDQQRRAPKTIETITSELFERELVNELRDNEKERKEDT